MPNLSRVGDKNEAGGAIMRGAKTVIASGKQVGLHVSQITPHSPWESPHDAATTTSASPSVFAEGVAVLRITSGNSCGHSIVEGSPDVFVP
jgi:uncharacterized Zn-binding protein involved in type VI secretion